MSDARSNADVVRRAYEAFNAGDAETLALLFAEDSSWHTPGKSDIAGDRCGRDDVFAQLGRYVGETDAIFRATLKRVMTSEDGRVIGVHHNSGEREGRRLDVDCCIAFEVADGQIVSGREFFFDLHAWDAFWA